MFFKRKPKLNEQTMQEIADKLEQAYVEKDIDRLTELFHPDCRNLSFLNHFALMMNFQIYNITSERLHFEMLSVDEDAAVFAYTRKHLYSCVKEADENGKNPNNISSYYVVLTVENKKIWITDYKRYSELFLDQEGEILPGELAVVPPRAEHYDQMKRFIDVIRFDHLQPASYFTYDDSEMIGYYLETERHHYRSSEKLTFDYFDGMSADSMGEHIELLMEGNDLLEHEVLLRGSDHSIIEIQFEHDGHRLHELILSMQAPDGFFMVRFLKSRNAPMDPELRDRVLAKMERAVEEIGVAG